jgi:hypothetical protein
MRSIIGVKHYGPEPAHLISEGVCLDHISHTEYDQESRIG